MRIEHVSEQWKVRIMDNGAVELTDIAKGISWGGRFAGWLCMRGEERAAIQAPQSVGKIENGLYANYHEQGYAFRAEWTVIGNRVELKLTELHCDGELVSLEYPAHMLRVNSGTDDGYVVVPHKQGALIPSKLEAGFMRHRHNSWKNICDIDELIPFEFCGLNMTWFGASNAGSSVMCYLEEAVDAALHVLGNAVVNEHGEPIDNRQGMEAGERYSSLTPVWRGCKGGMKYARTMQLTLVGNGYVGMAKLYRTEVQRSGRFVSLRDKIDKNPLVERMIGAPDIKIYIYTNRRNEPRLRSWSEPILDGYECLHTTFEQVGEMVEDMQQMGMERALVLLGGWNRAGYDREHIDMWPPAEKAGGVQGLARASQKGAEAGYIFSLHDNYQDIYPDSPSYDEKLVMKHPDGTPMLGGIWDGGLCRLVCSSQALALAQPNVEAVKGSTSVNSYYLDTTTSAQMYECSDPDHPLARKDDREYKKALLEYLAAQDWVVGAEAGVDWAVPVCTFFEGMPGAAVGLNQGMESADFGMMVPLFNLVYHDAVVCYWQHGQPFGREDHINHVLHDLISAQPSSWSLVYDQWADLKPLIAQCTSLLGSLHEKTAYHEMLSHEFLTDGFELQRSVFSDGTEVVVNFDICSHEYKGHTILPKGFWIHSLDGGDQFGRMSRDIVLE